MYTAMIREQYRKEEKRFWFCSQKRSFDMPVPEDRSLRK